jgi:hypothetical protein
MGVGIITGDNVRGVDDSVDSDVGAGNLDVGRGEEVGEGDSNWGVAVVVEAGTALKVVAGRCPTRGSCALLVEDNRVTPGRLHLVRATMHSRPTIRAAHPLRFHKFTSILSQKTSFGTSRHIKPIARGYYMCNRLERPSVLLLSLDAQRRANQRDIPGRNLYLDLYLFLYLCIRTSCRFLRYTKATIA